MAHESLSPEILHIIFRTKELGQDLMFFLNEIVKRNELPNMENGLL